MSSFLVAVLVEGVNDQPVADSLVDLPGSLYSTAEDEILVVQHPGVLENDLEADINSEGIDDKKMIIPVEGRTTDVEGAIYSRFLSKVQPPAAWSMIQVDLLQFDALAVGQSYTDTVLYDVFDGSYLFAEDDEFKVSVRARSSTQCSE